MTSSPPQTLFLAGPTASGKSGLAVKLAHLLDAEIVSSDAYQVYRELPLLSAAPTREEQEGIPHHMLGIISVSEHWDASQHHRMATECIRSVHERGKIAIVTGGSGLYFKFLSHGIAEAPPRDESLRACFASCSTEDLYAKLQALDPEGAQATDPRNRRYVERNLEIVIVGRRPLAYWKQNWLKPAAGPGWYLARPTEELDARIAERARLMMENGIIDEVRALPECSATAEKTLGLDLIRAHIRGELSYRECLEALALTTRQYAKRQRTWLRRESWLQELNPNDFRSADELARHIADSVVTGKIDCLK